MIAPQTLLIVKQRMLLAADAASHLANSDGEFLELEAEQFAVIHEALTSLKDDCGLVFAELDVLRGMFAQKVGQFFMEVANAGVEQGRDGGEPVGGVPDGSDQGRGEASRDDASAAGGRLHRGRATRQPRKRSNARRHRKGNGSDTGNLDASDGAGEMDRSQEA